MEPEEWVQEAQGVYPRLDQLLEDAPKVGESSTALACERLQDAIERVREVHLDDE